MSGSATLWALNQHSLAAFAAGRVLGGVTPVARARLKARSA